MADSIARQRSRQRKADSAQEDRDRERMGQDPWVGEWVVVQHYWHTRGKVLGHEQRWGEVYVLMHPAYDVGYLGNREGSGNETKLQTTLENPALVPVTGARVTLQPEEWPRN